VSHDVLALSVRDLARAIHSGDVSAREATYAYLAQLEHTEPHVHAWLRVTRDVALESADAIDAARARGEALGPLAGVPMGLKDLFVTKGIETTAGSKILQGWVPPYEGTHGQRLRAAGAVLLGKLAMDEFAMGSSNENTPFEKVRNPWALDHVPGGSSGGSAAAVAARSDAFTLGSDTGGSIRQPASLCNLVGFKPTYGRVSRYGMVAFASSLDQAGTFTRDVRDAALVMGTIAGHDPMDATSSHQPVPDWLAACERGAKGLRVGVHRDALSLPGLDPRVRDAFTDSLARLEKLGATLVDVELPHFRHAVATYYVLATAEASSNLARFDGVKYGLRVEADTLLGMYEQTREQGFGPEVKRRIMLGTFVLRAASYEQYYGRAMKVRSLVTRDYEQAFERCDVIASPTSPVPGFKLGEKIDDPLAMYLSDVFTIGVNLAGLPGVSVPAGFTAGGAGAPSLPIGLQLVGPRWREDLVFQAAAAHEDDVSFHREVAPAARGEFT
jgi:aspartyl-tRNA(Asn)/glutamyl-tRNA(Gln) amidotransferase subunit A